MSPHQRRAKLDQAAPARAARSAGGASKDDFNVADQTSFLSTLTTITEEIRVPTADLQLKWQMIAQQAQRVDRKCYLGDAPILQARQPDHIDALVDVVRGVSATEPGLNVVLCLGMIG
jgi:hypothetical protein